MIIVKGIWLFLVYFIIKVIFFIVFGKIKRFVGLLIKFEVYFFNLWFINNFKFGNFFKRFCFYEWIFLFCIIFIINCFFVKRFLGIVNVFFFVFCFGLGLGFCIGCKYIICLIFLFFIYLLMILKGLNVFFFLNFLWLNFVVILWWLFIKINFLFVSF